MTKTKVKSKSIGRCTNGNDHSFAIIKDEVLKKSVRDKHPKLQFPLWQCRYCESIIQST
jgi:hypothetical protein